MDAQTRVDEALNRETAAGRLTRLEAGELRRRLDVLAFKMTVAGREGELPQAVAARWMRSRLSRRLGQNWVVPPKEAAHAATWWAQGVAAGLLYERDDRIAFVDRAVQDEFCLHFCLTHPLTPHLLRLAARASFKEIWRRWAEHDPTLADQLNALLLGTQQTKGSGTRAALPLRYLGDMRAVDPLIAALSATDAGVCIRAAMALATLGDPRAIEPLNSRQVQEKSLAVRVPLIEALGGCGEQVLPVLTSLLEHPDQNVARASIRALGRTDTPEAAVPLIAILTGKGAHTVEGNVLLDTMLGDIKRLDNIATRRIASQASGENRSPAARQTEAEEIQAISARVRSYSDDPCRAEAAIHALGALGEHAIPALMESLHQDNQQARGYLLRALSCTHAVPAARVLLEQLKQDVARSSPSADAVGAALIELHCPQSADLLADALAEPNAVARSYVACALAALGDTRAAEPLLALLPQSDPQIRARVAGGLGVLGDARAVDPLIAALGAPEEYPRERDDNAPGQQGFNVHTLGRLLSSLRPELQVRIQAAEALGKLGDARAVWPLIRTLSDPNERLRWHAVMALGKIGGRQVIAPLAQGLTDSSQMVRAGAAYALGRLRAIEAFLAVLREHGVRTPPEVIIALGRMNDKRAVEPLLALLQAFGRSGVGEALRVIHGQSDREGMRAMQDLAGRCVAALLSLVDSRVLEPLLVGLLKEDDGSTAMHLAFALVQIGNRDTLAALHMLQQHHLTSTVRREYIRLAIDRLRRRLDQLDRQQPLAPSST